jgi:hypothetical protein
MEEETFSKNIPGLQLAWDSVSSGEFKRCPRAYQLGILQGWQSRERSVDLDFGIFLHEGREWYYRMRADGVLHDEAVMQALAHVLTITWDERTQRPWQGDERKNRFTLARTLVWYLDHWEHDPLTTMLFADGKPMVEMSFRLPLPIITQDEEPEQFILCGHLDRVGEYVGQVWVNDLKSTKSSIDEGSVGYFFAGFTPDNQISLYAFASQAVLANAAKGIMLDAAQVAQGFSRFARAPISRTRSQLEEWYEGFRVMLRQAEQYARDKFWPMNEKACFRCQFRSACALPPASREDFLRAHFTKREWDPLKVRGGED